MSEGDHTGVHAYAFKSKINNCLLMSKFCILYPDPLLAQIYARPLTYVFIYPIEALLLPGTVHPPDSGSLVGFQAASVAHLGAPVSKKTLSQLVLYHVHHMT